MTDLEQRRVYRFGLYEADTRSAELRKNGIKLRIQGQPFEVLVALLEHPNDVITREDLRRRLWPSDTFVDFDHSLNTAINKLRDLLGDTASNPRFIETLPKRGYRFLAPVQTTDPSAPRAEPSAPVPPSAGPAPVPASMRSAIPGRSHAATAVAVNPSTAADPAAYDVLATSPDLIEAHDLPRVHRGTGRLLFILIQIMYLCFYVTALWKLRAAQLGNWALFMAIILSAVIAIPLRLYLLTAAAFDYRKLGISFRRLWPAVFFFDLLWALSPFLVLHEIGFGLAFGACAALLYVPFSQRTLIRMTYPATA